MAEMVLGSGVVVVGVSWTVGGEESLRFARVMDGREGGVVSLGKRE